MTQQDYQSKFDANQKDGMCPDTWVQWAGNYAVLHECVKHIPGMQPGSGKELTLFQTGLSEPLIDRIVRWCAKNGYQCSSIQNGKIIL